MLNERLARASTASPASSGNEFRKVKLPPGCHRGGVMTQASVLKVTADGTRTSPGAARQVGAGAHPRQAARPAAARRAGDRAGHPRRHHHPPAARQAPQHRRPAPPATSTSTRPASPWRTSTRSATGASSTGSRPRTKARRREPAATTTGRAVYRGPDVEHGGETPDGREFKDIDDYKKILLEDKDQLARSLTQKLLIYATGADIQFADREVVEQIVAPAAGEELRLPHPGPRGRAEPGVLEQVGRQGELRWTGTSQPCIPTAHRHRPPMPR